MTETMNSKVLCQQQTTINIQEKASLIWNTADILRGLYKAPEYGKVILPMTVIKRLHNPAFKPPEKEDKLTEILNKINAQFLDTFTEEDRVILDMIIKRVVQNPTPKQKLMAKNNDFAMFKRSLFPKEFEDKVIALSQSSESTFLKLFNNQAIFDYLMDLSAELAYYDWGKKEERIYPIEDSLQNSPLAADKTKQYE